MAEGKIQVWLRRWFGDGYKSTVLGIVTTATTLIAASYRGTLSPEIIALALGGLAKSWFQEDSNGSKKGG